MSKQGKAVVDPDLSLRPMRKDTSTGKKNSGTGEGEPPCHWMLLALRILAARHPALLLTPASGLDAVKGLRRRPEVLEEHPVWNMHMHPTPEMCMTLKGSPVLALQHLVCTPRIAVIGAGVMHCEARNARGGDSALLWITPGKSSIGLSVSRYDRGCGWNNAWRYSFYDESVAVFRRALEQWIRSGGKGTDSMFAELMLVLTVVYRDLVTRSGASSPPRQKDAMLNHVKDYLDANFDKPITLREVAAMNQLTPNYLNSLFRRWQGKGIHAYLIGRRMEKAMRLCRTSPMAVKEIAVTVGFTDVLYFSKAFKDYHGIWPSRLKGR